MSNPTSNEQDFFWSALLLECVVITPLEVSAIFPSLPREIKRVYQRS